MRIVEYGRRHDRCGLVGVHGTRVLALGVVVEAGTDKHVGTCNGHGKAGLIGRSVVGVIELVGLDPRAGIEAERHGGAVAERHAGLLVPGGTDHDDVAVDVNGGAPTAQSGAGGDLRCVDERCRRTADVHDHKRPVGAAAGLEVRRADHERVAVEGNRVAEAPGAAGSER